MGKPFILYDYKMAPRYLACGDYAPSIPVLAFKSGLPGLLEKIALNIQRFLPRNRFFPSSSWRETISRINKSLGEKVVSALLYDTSWYKDTMWIGSITTDKAAYFVKIFRQMDDCLFEQHQHQFIKEHFSGSFITVPVANIVDTLLLTPIMPRMRDVSDTDHVEEKILLLNKQYIETSTTHKRPAEMLPMDLYALTFGSTYYDAIKKFGQWVESQSDHVTLVPVHGDMTPWNMFVNPEEKIVLVDYERAGWHVAYYDVFHFILQAAALKATFTPITDILSKYEWYNSDGMNLNLFLYLIDQIYFDLSQKLKNGHHHAKLDRLITTKLLWLEELHRAAA